MTSTKCKLSLSHQFQCSKEKWKNQNPFQYQYHQHHTPSITHFHTPLQHTCLYGLLICQQDSFLAYQIQKYLFFDNTGHQFQSKATNNQWTHVNQEHVHTTHLCYKILLWKHLIWHGGPYKCITSCHSDHMCQRTTCKLHRVICTHR